ncbi:MAG: hypothetical protein LBE55_07380 [Clostridiales bacterium]|jgi:hypothetical protein|nr:hypothetical protein [Clostridiales bacterium]
MNKLISDCNDFFKDCGFAYAICGGFALELFLNKGLRPHSDMDVSIFDENRRDAAKFLLDAGWSIYKYFPKSLSLVPIFDPEDAADADFPCIWAMKPGSHVIAKPRKDEENVFGFEFLNEVQQDFTYIEVIFNGRRGADFVCGRNENITRAIDKAILYKDDVPYLSPELILFFKSPPVYSTHEVHKDKTPVDFNAAAPFLPDESRQWLVKALETAYSDGHDWIEKLKIKNHANR